MMTKDDGGGVNQASFPRCGSCRAYDSCHPAWDACVGDWSAPHGDGYCVECLTAFCGDGVVWPPLEQCEPFLDLNCSNRCEFVE